MRQFEYKFELESASAFDGGANNAEQWLNSLGREGWELIAIHLCGMQNSYLGYWFKRAVIQ